MSLIQFLIQVFSAVPILDKWATEFTKAYHQHKFELAEKKARDEGNTEDLQKEMGREK